MAEIKHDAYGELLCKELRKEIDRILRKADQRELELILAFAKGLTK